MSITLSMLKGLSISFFLWTLPAFSTEYERELLNLIRNNRYEESKELALNINRQGLDLSSSHPISGETPLTMAVLKGWLKGVRLLLILRANPSIPNIDGLTPLMLAQKLGKADIERELTPLPLQDPTIQRSQNSL